METALTYLLIRFAVIAGGLVILALVVFAVALALKRRGKFDDAKRRVAPLVREGVRLWAQRAERKGELRR
ncbi:hypothetical protein [Streptomyces sp. NPDC001020]